MGEVCSEALVDLLYACDFASPLWLPRLLITWGHSGLCFLLLLINSPTTVDLRSFLNCVMFPAPEMSPYSLPLWITHPNLWDLFLEAFKKTIAYFPLHYFSWFLKNEEKCTHILCSTIIQRFMKSPLSPTDLLFQSPSEVTHLKIISNKNYGLAVCSLSRFSAF
jgi:hypothetical protein